jgi:hypothetical protein
MSAFVVSKQDIDILVAAQAARIQCEDKATLTELGRMLWRENVKSVAYRYDMPARHASEYAGYLKDIAAYQYEPQEWNRRAVADAVSCYDYQSCEHPGWEMSKAKRLIEAIETALEGVR